MKTVLQKYIASSGYCSRRQAEELIRAGKVFVDGEQAELGQRVYKGEGVTIGGKTISPKQDKVYIKLNKPRGYVCTNRNFDAEQNVFELLKDKNNISDHPLAPSFRQGGGIKGLHVVGRLDKNSHGLVILTNDGDFTEKMTHPRYQHEKEYLVRIKDEKLAKCQTDRNIEVQEITKELRSGVNIGDGDGVVKAKSVEKIGDKIFKIILTQGKKRQIRRMFEAVGHKVSDLERVRIGDIVLGDLKVREWEIISIDN